MKAPFSTVIAALVALSMAIAGSAHASGTTPAPSRGDSHQPVTVVHAQKQRPAGTARRVGWSAGPVERWTGYSRSGGSLRVREVQRMLRRPGFPAGARRRPLRSAHRTGRRPLPARGGTAAGRDRRAAYAAAAARPSRRRQRPATARPKTSGRSPDRPAVGPVPAVAARAGCRPRSRTQPPTAVRVAGVRPARRPPRSPRRPPRPAGLRRWPGRPARSSPAGRGRRGEPGHRRRRPSR